MSVRSLRTALLFLFGLAVACAVGVVGAEHVTSHTRLFLLVMLGAAGGLALVTAAVTVDPAWILSVGLGLSIFSGDWRYMHIPLPLDRTVTFVGFAVVLLRALFDPGAPKLPTRRMHMLMLALAIYAVGSAAVAGTISNKVAYFELLDRLGIEPFMFYLVAPAVFATSRQRRILLVIIAVVGAYLGLTAIFEKIGPHGLVVPRFIQDPALGIHDDRARGPFLEAGADGLAMSTSIVVCVMLLAEVRRPIARVGLSLTVLVCLLGLLLTLTRQVWIGAAAGFLIAAVLSPRLRRLVPVTVIVVGALTTLSILGIPGLRKSVESRTNDKSSLYDRYNSDDAALRMFEARPLFGFGWGTFPTKSGRYYRVARTYPLSAVSEVHNVALSNAAELGLVGLGGWLVAVVIAMLSPILRPGPPELEAWKLASVAIAIAWFVQSNFAPVSYAYDNYVPWIFAAIAYGATDTTPEAPLPLQRLPPANEVAGRIASDVAT